MANKKALDLDQLKTSLDAVKNWTSGEITNATKNKVDKDTVLLKDNTTEYTPIADYNPSTKKYVDDKITEAGGEYISANGGEYEYKNNIAINNVPFNNASITTKSPDTYVEALNDTFIYSSYMLPNLLGVNKESKTISDYQSAYINQVNLCIVDNHETGNHKHGYFFADYLHFQRDTDNGRKNFKIQANRNGLLFYNEYKAIDFDSSRLSNIAEPTSDSDAATKKYADTENKVAKRFVFDSDDNIIGVKIKDQVNNYNYILCMRNGTLATTCAVKSISITTNPTKMTYTAGSTIDTTGMIVTATCEDNSTREITGYTCTNTVTADNPKFTISYIEGGTTCTTELTVTVSAS